MNDNFPIFRTKLTLPQLKQAVLQRPAIMKKLRKIPDYPLTLVHSGPGYGKSTALASYLKNRADYCWYTVSQNDDGIIPFLHYLIESVRFRFSGFGDRILQKMDTLNQSESLQVNCAEFVNELSNIENDVILVIDDYHLLFGSSDIEEWMLSFIENLPDGVHLVLSSRIRPNWELITKFKAKGILLEIDESDFIFSYDEVDILFSEFFRIELNDEQIKEILKRTEGWIMAIQLIGQQLNAKEDLDRILKNRTQSLEDLFHFLAFEVLSKQPKPIQQFLRQTCIFEELNVVLLNDVLSWDGAGNMLKKVANQNLFLFSLGEGQYRYHTLFRDFLLRDLKQNDFDLFTRLNRCAGHYFKKQQLYEQAIYHYEAIQDYESAAQILQFYGNYMIQLGLLEGLKEKLDNLPADIKDRYEALWIYEGDIYRYRCHYDWALTCYKRAEQQTKENGNKLGNAFALEGLARVYLDTIQPGKAEGYLKEAIDLLEDEAPSSKRQIQLHRLMAENLVNLGRAREAEQWLKVDGDIPIDFAQNENLEARLFLRQGRLQEAYQILTKQKQREHEEGGHLQQSHRETDLLLSLIHSFRGETLKAKKLAQEGIIRGTTYRAPFVEACGWMRIGHAIQLSSNYDLDQALSCYETALQIMDEIHVPRGKAEPLMGLCDVYTQKGDYQTALLYGERALEETEKVDDAWLSSLIRLRLNVAAFYKGDFERSKQLLALCDLAFEQCGDQYGLTVSFLWKTIIAFEEKDEQAFHENLKNCLQMIETNHYEYLLERRTLFGPFDMQQIPPLLLEARRRGICNRLVSYWICKLGLSEKCTHPGYTLRVQTLGRFRVWLGNHELKPEDWRRDKAKELFQLLLTRRQQWVSKDEIFESLWPEQDETAASLHLKVAFNTLNKVLEPNRKARQTPYFVKRQGTFYRLNIEDGLQLDVEAFEKHVQKGLQEEDPVQATQHLEKGLSYYNGDYLEDRRFEDWCLEEKERIQVLFLRGSERLARMYANMENFDEAIRLSEAILEKDSCWEEAYRLLIYCYYQKNNRPQAVKWYRRCRYRLEKELGVEPMLVTQEMYEQVLQDAKPQIQKI